MLEENQAGGQSAQLGNQSVLDTSRIKMLESLLGPEPVKRSRAWIFKLILVLIIIGVVLYLFMNPEIITNPVNEFFGRFS